MSSGDDSINCNQTTSGDDFLNRCQAVSGDSCKSRPSESIDGRRLLRAAAFAGHKRVQLWAQKLNMS